MGSRRLMMELHYNQTTVNGFNMSRVDQVRGVPPVHTLTLCPVSYPPHVASCPHAMPHTPFYVFLTLLSRFALEMEVWTDGNA
eukprot:365955-Chlamydomonas_euryale.AAC.5